MNNGAHRADAAAEATAAGTADVPGHAAAAEAAGDEELAIFLKDDEILETESRKKVYLILFIF